MGDRMSAMKQAFQVSPSVLSRPCLPALRAFPCNLPLRVVFAFQAQYKNHFVAASGLPPKVTNTNSSSSAGWTSAGSLSSVPTGDPQEGERPRAGALAAPPQTTGTRMAGFTSAGTLSSLSDSYSNLPQGYPAPPAPREAPRDRHADSRDRHGEGHYRHGDRHGGERDRYGDRERHGDRDRYGDRERHGSGRYGDGRNGEGSRRDREGRSERDEWRGDREAGDRSGGEGRGDRSERAEDSFAVPDPPKRKKTRWDS